MKNTLLKKGEQHWNWKGGVSKDKEYVKERKRKYHKKWLKNNQEKHLKYQRGYYQKKKEQINKRKRKWYHKNTEKVRKYRKSYFLKNKEKINIWRRKWYQKNRDKILKRGKKKSKLKWLKNKKYYRETKITQNGKSISGVIKRTYPLDHKCEICEQKTKHLEYHHWDNPKIEKGDNIKGIWICHMCHKYITLMELNPNYPQLFQKYLKIKIKIDEEFFKKTPNN